MSERTSNDFSRIVWGLIGVALLLQVVIFVYAFSATGAQRQKVDAINRFIYCSLQRSEKSLPSVAYYRSHQAELAEQLRLIREQEHEFTPPPKPCAS